MPCSLPILDAVGGKKYLNKERPGNRLFLFNEQVIMQLLNLIQISERVKGDGSSFYW